MQLVQLSEEEVDRHIKDDSVRPHIPANFRVRSDLGRFTYGLKNDEGNIVALMCVAKGKGIPTTEKELETIGSENSLGDLSIIPYTIWSYVSGSGAELINNVIKTIKEEFSSNPIKPRVVTMSPKTNLAKRFHLRNGAELIAENDESNNFEYKIFE